jgi:glutamyl/glutaminyl-tRNA synthetase
VLSKRKLIQLVEEKHVSGWNDPRMPTISGVRRRGYTPEAMRLFAERIGISKADNNIDMSVLEDCARCKLGLPSAYILAQTPHLAEIHLHIMRAKNVHTEIKYFMRKTCRHGCLHSCEY